MFVLLAAIPFRRVLALTPALDPRQQAVEYGHQLVRPFAFAIGAGSLGAAGMRDGHIHGGGGDLCAAEKRCGLCVVVGLALPVAWGFPSQTRASLAVSSWSFLNRVTSYVAVSCPGRETGGGGRMGGRTGR